MQIHQPIPHGLLYSVEPQDLARFHLSDKATHDDFDWEEYESEYAEDSLAGNVVSFLKEFAGE
jgi:hypothetical protein